MRIYAAMSRDLLPVAVINSYRYPYVLATFESPRLLTEHLDYMPESLIVDSGAFTAWQSGKTFELDEYRRFAQFIVSHYHCDLLFVNMDVIAGAPGRASTPAEREAGMARSLANADILRGDGLRIMEVYHQEEPRDFLRELLARRQPHEVLCLSPRNDFGVKRRVGWLQAVYAELRCLSDTLPPCHVLAGTVPAMWETCPIYSTDSTSWIAPTRYGRSISKDGTWRHITDVLPHSYARISHRLLMRDALDFYLRESATWTRAWTARGFDWPEVACA